MHKVHSQNFEKLVRPNWILYLLGEAVKVPSPTDDSCPSRFTISEYVVFVETEQYQFIIFMENSKWNWKTKNMVFYLI